MVLDSSNPIQIGNYVVQSPTNVIDFVRLLVETGHRNNDSVESSDQRFSKLSMCRSESVEQLLAITRTHGEWERDPQKISLTPGSVSITSGVWPDDETSIEPVYWGVGNDFFAFLVTYHQHGEQKHPTAGWLKRARGSTPPKFSAPPTLVIGLSGR